MSPRNLPADADEVICLVMPQDFYAVGQGVTVHFGQTFDDEVVALLERAREGTAMSGAVPSDGRDADDPFLRDEEVRVTAGPVTLAGHLTIPQRPTESWCSPTAAAAAGDSPRNRYVAEVLNRAGLGTVLFDLLTPAEERDRANVFDIVDCWLSGFVEVTRWLAGQPRHRLAAGRLFRGQHRRGRCGTGRRRRHRHDGGGRGLPRRPPRPGGVTVARCPLTHLAARRRLG